MNRIIKILLIVNIAIAFVFVIPQKEASANPLALPLVAGGAEVAVGAYVVGGLVTAAVAGYMGVENADEIKRHSIDTWNNAQYSIKQSLLASYEGAIARGNNIMYLSQDVLGYLSSTTADLVVHLSSSAAVSGQIETYGLGWTSTAPWEAQVTTADGYRFAGSLIDRAGFVRNSVATIAHGTCSRGSGVYVFLQASADCKYAVAGPKAISLSQIAEYNAALSAQAGLKFLKDLVMSFGGVSFYKADTTVTDYNAEAAAHMTSLMAHKDVISPTIDKILEGAAQGVYIPNATDGFVAYPANPAGARVGDVPLVYNPSKPKEQAWENQDGSPYTGGVTWDFPLPGVTVGEGGEVISPPTVVVGNPPVSVPVTGEGAGTTTGEGTGTGTTPPTGSEPKPTKKPDETANKWKALVSTNFPFSLPWDLYNIIAVLAADPVTPKIGVDKDFSIAGISVPFEFEHDLKWTEPYMPFFRTLILFGFIIGLIYSTRTLLGGGQ